MEIKKLPFDFSVGKLKDLSTIDFTQAFCFVGKTDEEISLVCVTQNMPDNMIDREDGWKAFRIEGTLDFSFIGILSKITTLLAENRIAVFVISTYNTDYILTKAEQFQKALDTLGKAGYQVI